MANNYTHVATLLEWPRPAAEYAAALNERCNELLDPPSTTTSTSVSDFIEETARVITSEFIRKGAIFEVTDDGLFITSDESIDLDLTAAIVQETLRRFDDLPPAIIEWARTCDQPRPGEFGGGAVVITAERVLTMTTTTWAATAAADLASRARRHTA